MARKLMGSLFSFGLLAALTVPFGTVTHLFAEIVGLGEASEQLLISPRHAYLAVLVTIALIVVAVALRPGASSAERKRRIERVIASLPDRGTGPRFLAYCASFQLAFFAATQIAEGTPIAAGNLGLAIVAAIIASFAGALAIDIFKTRLLFAIAATLSWTAPHAAHPPAIAFADVPRVPYAKRRILTQNILNRPPPRLLTATP